MKLVPTGRIGMVRLPQIVATSDQGRSPSPATLYTPGSS